MEYSYIKKYCIKIYKKNNDNNNNNNDNDNGNKKSYIILVKYIYF